MPSEIRFVQANGLRFAYVQEGPNDGPLCIMLHGFPDTPQTWDHVRPVIAALGFRVVTPFTRGYAPTEIPKQDDYGADTLGGDALALATALGAEKFVLVGHDWGASAAYSAAGIAPERITLLVTIAIPHPASMVPTPSLLWAVRHFFALRPRGKAAQMRADGMQYIDHLVHRWSPAWNVPAGETDAVKRSLGEPGSLEAALGYYRALTPLTPEAQKKRVSCAAVAFAGEGDMVPVSAYERARKRYTARYEVVTMPGGHFMHREYPDVFARELARVLTPFAPRT